MNIRDFKRSLWAMPGLRAENAGTDGGMAGSGEGGYGSDNGSRGGDYGDSGDLGGGMYGNVGTPDGANRAKDSQAANDALGLGPDSNLDGANRAKDSQDANVQLGFEATNQAANDARMTDAERETYNVAMSKLTTEQRTAIANEVSRVASMPPQERSQLANTLMSTLSRFGLVGSVASSIVGKITAPTTPYSTAMGMADTFSKPAPASSSDGTGSGNGAIDGFAGSNGGTNTNGGGNDYLAQIIGAINNQPAAAPAPVPTSSWTSNSGDMGNPITLATSIANQSWTDWTGTKAALQAKVDANGAAGNAFAATSRAAADKQLVLAGQMQDDYRANFAPAGKQLSDYVTMLGTPGYRDQQRQGAMADVSMQSALAQQEAQRNASRMNINPASGRALAMTNQNAIATATARAGAGTMAERNANADWSKGLTSLTGLGLDTLKTGQAVGDSAQKWGQLGLDAGSTGFMQGMDLGKLGAVQTQTSGQVAGTAANALANSKLADARVTESQANTKIAQDKANPWTTIGGALVTDFGKNVIEDWFKPTPSLS